MIAFLLGCVLFLADDLTELRARAAKGEPNAMFDLGWRHHKGDGVVKDDKIALQWYEQAAAKDHTKAEVQLGYLHAHGFGTKLDFVESNRWYRRAALKGDTTALHNMGLQALHGQGTTKDATMAAMWFRRAAEQGHARAQFNLGECFENGVGVEKSPVRALLYFTLAARHPEQERLFGTEKAAEVVRRRDKLLAGLDEKERQSLERLADMRQKLDAVHPRKFGQPGGVGGIRGWYIWESWDPQRGVAEVRNEAKGERYTVRALPWATSYRHLVYGAGRAALLPGERVNLFFAPDERHDRGYLVHFQDEIGQMRGHGHVWQIGEVTGKSFVARVMAGDKPLDGKDYTFFLDPRCQRWQGGKVGKAELPAKGDKVYLTWCAEKERKVVKVLCDEASLEALRKQEETRVNQERKELGFPGLAEMVEDNQVHLLLFATHWQQLANVQHGQEVVLHEADGVFQKQGDGVIGKVVFRKNRGTYGSGATDLIVEVKSKKAAALFAAPYPQKNIRLLVR